MLHARPRRALPVILIGLTLLLSACQSAPITGRNQLILFPEGQDAQMGATAYTQILSQSRVSNNRQMNQTVRRVGQRIAAVSGRSDFDWEFTVIEDENPNAFALPGGKVGVNTGLFKVAKTEGQLAAVMAHEVGHAIARHGSERVSQQMMVQFGLVALGAATEMSGEYMQLAAQAATLGVVLPFGRNQESEADHIGLLLMAEAGYDPREAVDLWQNFAAFGGGRPPEFLSTHPSPGNRIQRIQQLLPQAMPIYEAKRRR